MMSFANRGIEVQQLIMLITDTRSYWWLQCCGLVVTDH